MRLCRERRRSGARYVRVLLHVTQIEGLIRAPSHCLPRG
jgi:hypothetical protein